MPYVVLDGPKPGLQKVALTKLLREHAGLSLAEAKACTDRYLAGERIVLEMPTAVAAQALAHDAATIGASVDVREVLSPQPAVA